MQPKAALRNGQPAPAQARSGWIMPFVFRTAGPSSQLIWTAVNRYKTLGKQPRHDGFEILPWLQLVERPVCQARSGIVGRDKRVVSVDLRDEPFVPPRVLDITEDHVVSE